MCISSAPFATGTHDHRNYVALGASRTASFGEANAPSGSRLPASAGTPPSGSVANFVVGHDREAPERKCARAVVQQRRAARIAVAVGRGVNHSRATQYPLGDQFASGHQQGRRDGMLWRKSVDALAGSCAAWVPCARTSNGCARTDPGRSERQKKAAKFARRPTVGDGTTLALRRCVTAPLLGVRDPNRVLRTRQLSSGERGM